MNDLNDCPAHVNELKWEVKDITKHTFKGLSTGFKGEFLGDELEELLGIKLLNVTSVKTIYINI